MYVSQFSVFITREASKFIYCKILAVYICPKPIRWTISVTRSYWNGFARWWSALSDITVLFFACCAGYRRLWGDIDTSSIREKRRICMILQLRAIGWKAVSKLAYRNIFCVILNFNWEEYCRMLLKLCLYEVCLWLCGS